MVALCGETPYKDGETHSGLGSASELAQCCIWPNTLLSPGTLACAKSYVSLVLEPDLGILLGSKWQCSVTVLNTAEGLKKLCRPTRHPFLKMLLKFHLKKL